jgi:hypothetical protein
VIDVALLGRLEVCRDLELRLLEERGRDER